MTEILDLQIMYYFLLGLPYMEILAFLKYSHKMSISMSTLKRRLKTMQLFRKKHFSSLPDILDFINAQIERSGQLHGYRWMHSKCLQNGLSVTNRDVSLILREVDPEGVVYRARRRLRRRRYSTKGPNYIWHVDSYDKLKPYGIALNGAIDGFSRKIIWLHAGQTASDPRVIGGYFINAVKSLGGCPRRLRSDCGTENRIIEQFQRFFRENPVDISDNDSGNHSHIYGTSQMNQRIESWWSILRKQCSQFWMNFFQDMKENDLFNGSFLEKSLIQFWFLDIIQNELVEVTNQWNSHLIRPTRNAISPQGRPMVMYELPQIYNTIDYMCGISQNNIQAAETECTFLTTPCDEDVFGLCKIIMEEQNLTKSTDPYEARQLYINLNNEIKTLLNM